MRRPYSLISKSFDLNQRPFILMGDTCAAGSTDRTD